MQTWKLAAILELLRFGVRMHTMQYDLETSAATADTLEIDDLKQLYVNLAQSSHSTLPVSCCIALLTLMKGKGEARGAALAEMCTENLIEDETAPEHYTRASSHGMVLYVASPQEVMSAMSYL